MREGDDGGTRVERDALGDVEVPAGRLWGAQTERARRNFPIDPERTRFRRPVIRALGVVKKAAALANADLGELSREVADLVARAAQEVIDGRWDDEFPLTAFQTGSGTQSNMNANEVIANRAIQLAGGTVGSKVPVHPNDHVNRGQSSNDVFPSVLHVATLEELDRRLLPALRGLRATFLAKAKEHGRVVLLGRTHLQDATPVTLGQVLSGWAAQLDAASSALEGARGGLFSLALGGTAVGTGLNAHPRFGDEAIRRIADETGKPFVPAPNRFAALSSPDAMAAASAALRLLAGDLLKIVNDVRWYASGPRGGIGELLLPENEPGSSIMPGKVNPTQCESLAMVAARVHGNDQTIAFAHGQGSFQLNTYLPVILHAVLESLRLLADGIASFDERCARGIAPNAERIARNLGDSLMLATALTPHIGYDRAAAIARAAHAGGLSLKEAAEREGVSAEEFDGWVRPERMTGPG